MRLQSFRVRDFRSINDSTQTEVAERTVLVGRNESGKTAILKALHGVKGRHLVPGDPNPKELVDFSLARDFPRDRPRSEYSPEAVVTWTKWELSDADRVELAKVWPRGATASHAIVERQYKAARRVGFDGAGSLDKQVEDARKAAEKATKLVRSATKGESEKAAAIDAPIVAFEEALKAPQPWAAAQTTAASTFRAAIAGAGVVIPPAAEQSLVDFEKSAKTVSEDPAQAQAARNWITARMPVFVYLEEWEQVTGHHVISEYLQRRASGNRLDQDRLFDKLLKVADLNAEELERLLAQQHEERTLLTDRASRVFTKRIQELWKDRELEVQFRIDAQHFDVLVKDVDTQALVPLDERSRGFRWYFSFYVTFSADTLGGDKENAVLLLDEPGLFLHAMAQGQLLKFFSKLKNQIIYSTHSPFMIDPNDLGSVRTVTLEAGAGTVVSADLSGDARTLFPLQAALGYDITQTLFVGTKNVVIEGPIDFWYLSSVAEYLRAEGKPSLPEDIVLTPAGGAQKVSYMVALLAAQNLHVVVLLDTEPGAVATRDDLVKSKLIRSDAVLQVADAFAAPAPKEADIEDLIEESVFMGLVQEAYKSELAGKKLSPNKHIPRIVPRLEKAFEAIGLQFAKSRVGRLFMKKMATDPAALLAGGAEQRFATLLDQIAKAVAKSEAANREPFR